MLSGISLLNLINL